MFHNCYTCKHNSRMKNFFSIFLVSKESTPQLENKNEKKAETEKSSQKVGLD